MEASESKDELPSGTSEEELPTEPTGAAPKKTKMVAAIVVAIIIVVAAIAVAFMAGLFGGTTPPVNAAPTVQTTISTHIANIGDTVTYTAIANDTDGTIAGIVWHFGDGETSTVFNTTHSYDYAGSYIVYAVVTDDDNATGDNILQISAMTILVQMIAPDTPSDTDVNATAPPFVILTAAPDIIEVNKSIEFYAGGSWAWVGSWVNESDHSEGIDWSQDIAGIDPLTLNFSDSSALKTLNTSAANTTHKFTTPGNYAVVLTGKSGTDTSVYIKTVQILKAQSSWSGAVKNPDTYVWASIGEPDTLDPAIDYETSGGEVLQNVAETLIWYNGASAKDFVPLLCTEVPSAANGRIGYGGLMYNFTLRQGITFHDGTDFTAEDVNYSFQRVAKLDAPGNPGWMVEQAVNGWMGFKYMGGWIGNWTSNNTLPAYLTAGLPIGDYTHIITEADVMKATGNAIITHDAYNISIRLTLPYKPFLSICAFNVLSIMSKDFIVANGDDYMDDHTCGTGPYKLVSWEKNSAVRLVRNDDYWRTPASIKNIVLMKVEDNNARMLLLKAGDADSIDLAVKFENQFTGSEFRIQKGDPTFDIVFMGFNQNINIADLKLRFGNAVTDVPSDFFADINVRRAFASSIDYATFISGTLLNNGQQLNGPIPQGMFGYDGSVPKMQFNLTYAKSQLENATTDWIATGFTIPIFYNAGNTNRQTACEMIRDNLNGLSPNIHVSVIAQSWSVLIPMMLSEPCSMPMWCIGWAPDYADPDDYVYPFMYSMGDYGYFVAYNNATVDTLFLDAQTELNDTIRAEMYSEITWAAYYDCPYIWLYQAKNFNVERTWVHGYVYNPMYSNLIYYDLTKG